MVQYTLELPASSATTIEQAIRDGDIDNLKAYVLIISKLEKKVSVPEWLSHPEAKITQVRTTTTISPKGGVLHTRITILFMKD